MRSIEKLFRHEVNSGKGEQSYLLGRGHINAIMFVQHFNTDDKTFRDGMRSTIYNRFRYASSTTVKYRGQQETEYICANLPSWQIRGITEARFGSTNIGGFRDHLTAMRAVQAATKGTENSDKTVENELVTEEAGGSYIKGFYNLSVAGEGNYPATSMILPIGSLHLDGGDELEIIFEGGDLGVKYVDVYAVSFEKSTEHLIKYDQVNSTQNHNFSNIEELWVTPNSIELKSLESLNLKIESNETTFDTPYVGLAMLCGLTSLQEGYTNMRQTLAWKAPKGIPQNVSVSVFNGADMEEHKDHAHGRIDQVNMLGVRRKVLKRAVVQKDITEREKETLIEKAVQTDPAQMALKEETNTIQK